MIVSNTNQGLESLFRNCPFPEIHLPKLFKTHWKEQDWAGPVVELIYTAFLVALDAVKIAACFAIGLGLEWVLLDVLHIGPMKFGIYSFGVEQLTLNFDYTLAVLFFYLLIRRVMSPKKRATSN
jgi:hypothetical protein